MSLDHFHISLNISSVALAMQNLGFEHLHLVAPRGYDRERACVTALPRGIHVEIKVLAVL